MGTFGSVVAVAFHTFSSAAFPLDRRSLRDLPATKFCGANAMKQRQGFRLESIVLFIGFVLVAGLTTVDALAASAKAPFASGYILVGKNPTSAEGDFLAGLGPGASSIGKLRLLDVHVVNVPPGNEQAVVKRLLMNPHVKFAEVDALVAPGATPNDPSFPSEWHLTKISAPSAWDMAIGTGVTIAILDTGVDGTHPDLAPHLVPGWNFHDNNSNTSDVYGHGTSVAGAAAAAMNNGIGVAGVAGAARIMPVRISDPSGYALWSTVANGLVWAADHGARVANISYSVAGSSSVNSAANYFRSKGGVVAVSAGNTGAVDNSAPPASMLVIAATDSSDARAGFSTFGAMISLAAPGVSIYTTANGGGYRSASGTSFSSPIVAGAAALVLSRRPDYSPAQVESALKVSATDLGTTGSDVYFGAGRLNAAGAVTLAATSGTGDSTPPATAIASPTGGTVTGTVTVSASASDNVGVTRVELRVNGVTVGTDTTGPYQWSWNSASVPNGVVQLTAAAFDAAGNSKVSAPVSVTVSNGSTGDTTPPTVSISSLSANASSISGTVTVLVSATDNVGVTRVDLKVNGSTVATGNTSPYQFSWNSTTFPDGPATLTAVAFDAAGNSRVSSGVAVTIANDRTAPVLAITSPANGAILSGQVTIATTASDNNGAAGITQRLYIDGALKSTATARPLSIRWNTKPEKAGVHTIMVTATDRAGNTTTRQIQVTTVK
jgi:thermitase